MSDRYQEWLNRNANISFPFVEDFDHSCSNGSSLPDSLVLDMRVCSFGTETASVRLVSAVVRDGAATLDFLFDGDGEIRRIEGSGWVSGRFGDASYRIRLCDASAMAGIAGEYRLVHEAPLLRSRVVDIPFGIGADTLSDGETVAIGEVVVADGHNTTLDISGNDLRLRIRMGDGKGVECPEQEEGTVCDGRILYYLNGQKAGSDGNIQLVGGSGVSVSHGEYRGIPAIVVQTDGSVEGFLYR